MDPDNSNSNCAWKLTASPGNLVVLSFTDFMLEQSPDCTKDYTEIQSQDEKGENIQVARYCGEEIACKNCEANTIFITFVSDDAVETRGFVAHYSHIWGTSISATSGQVASPLYPHYYINDVVSEWTITLMDNIIIRYNMLEFDVVCNDKLTMYDSFNSDGKILFDGCDAYLIEVPSKKSGITTGSTMFIKFVSDHLLWGHGFLMDYTSEPSHEIPPNPTPDPIDQGTCGNDFVVAGLTPLPIVSPGFPNNYANDLDCYWYLYTTANASMAIYFTEIDIERSDGCKADYLSLIDGPTMDHDEGARLCGIMGDITIETTGHEAILQFHSNDRSNPGRGFNGTYYQKCGGLLQGRSGSIQSNNWPMPYTPGGDCIYQIRMDQGLNGKIMFDQPLAIDGSMPNCDKEGDGYIRLLNGGQDAPPMKPEDVTIPPSSTGTYCGRWADAQTAPPTLVSTVSTMTVIFRAGDNQKNYEGFSLHWSANEPACGEVIDFVSPGSIQAPGYPQMPPDQYCVWTISVARDSAVQLDWNAFDLSAPNGGANCDVNFVTIYDQYINHDQPIAKYCGRQLPPTTKTLGHIMTIKLVAGQESKGFKAMYSISACGGFFSGYGGTLKSEPRTLSTSLRSDLNCESIIQGPEHSSIVINFFDIFNVPCQKQGGLYYSGDFIEIIEYSKEGYFWLQDPVTKKAFTLDTVTNSITLSEIRLDPKGVFDQLWLWDYLYIRSVEDYSLALTVSTQTANPVVNDPLVASRFGPTDLQKWIYSDGRLQPFLDPSLFVTASSDDSLNMQKQKSESENQVFDSIMSDVGRTLGQFCGTDLPTNISSLSNELLILHHVEGRPEDSIWSFNWTVDDYICGEELNTDRGSISSPNYPDPYDMNRRCEWTITVNAKFSVTLIFKDWDMRTSDGCIDHYLQAFDGKFDYSPALTNRLCSSGTPAPIISHGNVMKVIFETNNESGERGFKANFNAEDTRLCGADYTIIGTAPTLIQSPYYPHGYNDSTECDWTLHALTKYDQTFYFDWGAGFDLEGGTNCEFDAVEAYIDGDYTNYHSSHNWYTFCGHDQPKPFGLPGPAASIIFHANQQNHYEGFELTVSMKECGGVFGGENEMTGGQSSSPNYPDRYNPNDYCIWLLVAPAGHTVAITFTNSFDLDGPTAHSDCRDNDWVRVLNGPNMQAPVIGTFCSTNRPQLDTAFHTTGNEAIIIFKSDKSGEKSGFTFDWQADDGECGNKILQSETGKVTSPGYLSHPQPNYPKLMNCIWTISTAKNTHVELTFSDFVLEAEKDGICFDYVEVWNGKGDNYDNLIDRYCGRQLPPKVVTSHNVLTLKMVTDDETEEKGFAANWITVCGENPLGEMLGLVQSVNFGSGNYTANQNCVWNITSYDSGDLIEVKFKSIAIEPNPQCSNDYVALYKNNEISYDNKLGNYCGFSIPKETLKSRGTMLINFVTNDIIEDVGWSAEFSVEKCGKKVKDISGRITNYHASNDDGDHNNLNCTWQFEALDPTLVVSLRKWSEFDIEYSPTCAFDYIAIYDGPNTLAPYVGRYCGKEPPRYIRSTGSTLTLEYITDDYITSAGFTVEWAQTLGPQQGCGGKIDVTTTGHIVSPTNPDNGNYYPDLTCVWELSTENALRFSFKKFILEDRETEYTGACFDFVEIIDGPHLSDRVIFGPQCGTLDPFIVKGSSQMNHIIFISDPFDEYEGFDIEYAPYISNCGGDLIANDEVKTLKWDYDGTNSNCHWNIKTDPGHYVHIEPQSLVMPEPTDEYKLPISVKCDSYQYVTLLENMHARKVTSVKMNIKDITSDAHIAISPSREHDEVAWEIVLGGWDTTRSCIRWKAMTDCLVDTVHTPEDFQRWIKNVELRIGDRSFGLYDGETGNAIVVYNDTPEHPIVKIDFTYLLVSGYDGQRPTFTATDVGYQVGKSFFIYLRFLTQIN